MKYYKPVHRTSLNGGLLSLISNHLMKLKFICTLMILSAFSPLSFAAIIGLKPGSVARL